MIKGSIDNFLFADKTFLLSGWAFSLDGENKIPIERFTITSKETITFNITSRPDISNVVDFGFRFAFTNLETLFGLFEGSVNVLAHYLEETEKLNIWSVARGNISSFFADHFIKQSSPVSLSAIIDSASRLMRANTTQTNVATEYFKCNFPVGARSLCGNAIMGRDGYLFLDNGANNLRRLYEDSIHSERVSNQWLQLIETRRNNLADLGVNYLQIITPEKQSVVPELYPEFIITPTTILKNINKMLEGFNNYFDSYQSMVEQKNQRGIIGFRKLDTHLNYFGVRLIGLNIVSKIALNSNITISKPKLYINRIEGDLGDKFSTSSMIEEILLPLEKDWDFANKSPILKFSHNPPTGHTGTVLTWDNPAPLVEEDILIFGNSIFERGGSCLGLTWWLNRIFSKTTFVWSHKLSYEMVKELRPRHVICQTVERFLHSVPKS